MQIITEPMEVNSDLRNVGYTWKPGDSEEERK
jgi:hypothetical protein